MSKPKWVLLFLALAMIAFALPSCSSDEVQEETRTDCAYLIEASKWIIETPYGIFYTDTKPGMVVTRANGIYLKAFCWVDTNGLQREYTYSEGCSFSRGECLFLSGYLIYTRSFLEAQDEMA